MYWIVNTFKNLCAFSPDGKVLVFLSSKSAVDSGAHSATDSLHKIDWPADGKPNTSPTIYDVASFHSILPT